MQDQTLDEGTTNSWEDVLSGLPPGCAPIRADRRAQHPAIQTMQRQSIYRECNWGLEYDRGSAMSLGHLPKARALARSNALYGVRQMAPETPRRVRTWLADCICPIWRTP